MKHTQHAVIGLLAIAACAFGGEAGAQQNVRTNTSTRATTSTMRTGRNIRGSSSAGMIDNTSTGTSTRTGTTRSMGTNADIKQEPMGAAPAHAEPTKGQAIVNKPPTESRSSTNRISSSSSTATSATATTTRGTGRRGRGRGARNSSSAGMIDNTSTGTSTRTGTTRTMGGGSADLKQEPMGAAPAHAEPTKGQAIIDKDEPGTPTHTPEPGK